jgi:hypothetical protein
MPERFGRRQKIKMVFIHDSEGPKASTSSFGAAGEGGGDSSIQGEGP